jgi:hypothetical protein
MRFPKKLRPNPAKKHMQPRITLVVVALNLVSFSVTFGKSAAPIVTFTSPCECQGFHGADRWSAKTDSSIPPRNKREIQAIIPSQIYRWPGPGPKVSLTRHSDRIAAEQKWYALTGRVVDLRVEADGDIHIALKDANDNKEGIVGVEVPVGTQWCEIRKRIFGWTTRSYPFHLRSALALKIRENHVITVTGKAFFDIDHAPKDHSNRRNNQPGYAAWELHPVMKLTLVR